MRTNHTGIRDRLHSLRAIDWHSAGRRAAGLFGEGWYVRGDPAAKDRVRLLGYHYEANVVANLIGGTFYTGLLLLMNADDAFIGAMSMISSGANMLQCFAPLLLERFPQRKKLLVWLRSIILFFNVLFLGLIPLFPFGQQARLTLVAGTVLIINLLNAVTNPGFSIWTIQSVPPNVRGPFFTIITMTVGAVVAVFNLAGSAVVDFFTARGNEYVGLLILRLFCVGLVVLDTISYAKMREYPYPGSGRRFTVKDLLVTPFREKLYMRTVAVTFLWNIAANIPGSYYTVYLLRNVQVSYSFIMLVSMVNVPVVLFLTPVVSRLGRKMGMSWFKMLYVSMGLYLLHYVILGFVGRGTIWLYPIGMLYAYVTAIGINLSFTCIPYVNMPRENQTAFIGFYSTAANLAVFLGVYIGRTFVTGTESLSLHLLGMDFGGKQLLLFLTAALMIVSVAVIRYIDRTTKKADEQETKA